mmetsp:Transcript_540/g.1264  ORF Transcript_540/g.1264 Transcript_540/m.1264 type:complete len:440 (+) Transcript_540:1278-2597(+)
MGLNLTIRRIIFSTLEKFDGIRRRLLHSSEVKQIAGRAGRFGTAYSAGEVTTLHAADGGHLRHCLLQPDDAVRQAGIFPSREQLELLGALLDNRVTSSELLMAFWDEFFYSANHYTEEGDNHFDKDWDDGDSDNLHCGDDSDDGESGGEEGRALYSPDDVFRAEFVLLHFPSMRAFSKQLTLFLKAEYASRPSSGDGWAPSRSGRKSRSASADTTKWNESRFPQTPLSTLLTVFKNSVTFPTLPDQFDVENGIERGGGSCRNLRKKIAKKNGKQRTRFSSRESGNSLYFVGDLDETRQVAEVLETVVASSVRTGLSGMTFRDQYLFSLAPINVDNQEVVRALRVITERYMSAVSAAASYRRNDEETAKELKVVLPKKYLKFNRSPRNSEDLAKLETTHQIMELFIWLSFRFPACFDEVEAVQQRCQECSAAIERALRPG